MNDTFCIILAVSIVLGVIGIWRIARSASVEKRFVLLALFIWPIVLLLGVQAYDYWKEFYSRQQGDRFMREATSACHCLGKDEQERGEILGLVFAEPETIADPAVNIQKAMEIMRQRRMKGTNDSGL